MIIIWKNPFKQIEVIKVIFNLKILRIKNIISMIYLMQVLLYIIFKFNHYLNLFIADKLKETEKIMTPYDF